MSPECSCPGLVQTPCCCCLLAFTRLIDTYSSHSRISVSAQACVCTRLSTWACLAPRYLIKSTNVFVYVYWGQSVLWRLTCVESNSVNCRQEKVLVCMFERIERGRSDWRLYAGILSCSLSPGELPLLTQTAPHVCGYVMWGSYFMAYTPSPNSNPNPNIT